ncbi:MAG TPA: putative peptidoglycan glycosyltransferase FtsW [Candidatus Saccharimonadales bacterium]|nr:putative peptidoglycan glycosyltransferase FtsW [Candidatus Saccharimonadales bacterium]
MIVRSSPSRPALASDAADTRRHRPDYWLLALAVCLVAIGVTVVYAITPALSAIRGNGSNFVSRQVIAIALSAVAFLITARVPLRTWQKWQLPLLAVAGFGTLVALVTPVNVLYPAHRWIRLGPLSVQSVEILKFVLIIALAGFFATRQERGELGSTERTLKPLGIVLILLMIVVAGPSSLHGQSDLGSMAVILGVVAAMALMVGMPFKRIALVGLAIVALVAFVITISPYRRARLTSFIHPDCLTASGYQACQAITAVGSGGIIGQGLGGGASSYGYLPEAQNDSIFAIYAEKFGFIGVMILFALFATLFARLRLIIERAPDTFSRLIVTGVLAWLSVQLVINIGAMIGLLPLKGITLPFISYGGTSVLFVGAALGLVFQISHYTSFSARNVANRGNGQRNNHEDSNDSRRVRGAYHPAPGSRA